MILECIDAGFKRYEHGKRSKNMMDIQKSSSLTTPPQKADAQALFMREQNERMAGSTPEWRGAGSAREQSVFRLSEAAQGESSTTPAPSPYVQSFKGYMVQSAPKDKAYGVDDMIDMINPLQHLPLVGSVYRGLTGDEINPASRIIGGAVFGGGLGASASIANVISEEETGKDVSGLIVSKIVGGRASEAYQESARLADKIVSDYEQNKKPRYNE